VATSARTEVSSNVLPPKVAPLRAGQGTSFLLRRLHSLSGIIPIGAFLVEHFISNAFATNGVKAYNDQVKFLTGIPFVVWVETLFIYIPIAYHSVYGFYIWWRGETNVNDYRYMSNWMYAMQRWTGIVAFVYMAYHVYYMRFSGAHLIGNSEAAFGKVYLELSSSPFIQVFYFVGIIAAAWHFGYGLFLFSAKWGLVTGERGRRRMFLAGTGITAVLIVVGVATMLAFLNAPKMPNQSDDLKRTMDAVRTGPTH
jgi:succinate dehydrogenase cytochrome b subunit